MLLIILRLLKAPAIHHITANGKVLRRLYQETADRARGLAYYLRHHGFKRVGILAPNTPAFLESIFGIAAAGAVNVGMSCALTTAASHDDVTDTDSDKLQTQSRRCSLLL